jgi:type II secretory pathway pseudopilin PulG
MRGGFALLALLVVAVLVPAASAGTGGTWTPVTPDFNENFNLVGLHRTADGVLHVAAQAQNAANPQHGDFIHIPIPPGGTVGSPTVISGDWNGTNSPDITAGQAGGLLAVWGGIHTVTTGDPLNNGTFATSDDTGTAWTVDPTGPWPSGGSAGGTYVYASQVGTGNGADGTPFETWSHGGVYVHRGLDPSTSISDYNAQLNGQTTSIPEFALDSGTGSLWLGWQNNLSAVGVYAQQVDSATGAPVGSPALMPFSVVQYQGHPESVGILGRTPITGRPGRAGVWMAYPTGYPSATKLLVWKVGDPTSTTLVDTKNVNVSRVAITADPDGHVIVAWSQPNSTGGAGKVFVRVSNTNVTSWGPTFEVPAPKGFSEEWALQTSAQSGALLDIVQNFTEGDQKTMRFWHTQAVAPPELAKAVDASVVSGSVLIKLPGTNTFVSLTHASQIPVGAVVDATNGRVRIVEALPGGGTKPADFFQGIFQVGQARTGLATMTLLGGNFNTCGKAARAAQAAKVTVVRQLWGAGKGKFRTKGKYASASIRGTTWLTQDRCDGTLIRVTQGAVTVTDLVKHKNAVITKGHSYLAKKR